MHLQELLLIVAVLLPQCLRALRYSQGTGDENCETLKSEIHLIIAKRRLLENTILRQLSGKVASASTDFLMVNVYSTVKSEAVKLG